MKEKTSLYLHKSSLTYLSYAFLEVLLAGMLVVFFLSYGTFFADRNLPTNLMDMLNAGLLGIAMILVFYILMPLAVFSAFWSSLTNLYYAYLSSNKIPLIEIDENTFISRQGLFGGTILWKEVNQVRTFRLYQRYRFGYVWYLVINSPKNRIQIDLGLTGLSQEEAAEIVDKYSPIKTKIEG